MPTMRVFNCLSGGILCGLTLLLIFLPCFTPEWAGNLIFISLSAIPICIADGIIFAILLWKHNRWWMLYLLLLLGSSPILSGYFPLHFLHREEVPDSNQLKLVCWNAEGFRLNKDTLAKAAHSIRILQPGIVCLQEPAQRRHVVGKLDEPLHLYQPVQLGDKVRAVGRNV